MTASILGYLNESTTLLQKRLSLIVQCRHGCAQHFISECCEKNNNAMQSVLSQKVIRLAEDISLMQ